MSWALHILIPRVMAVTDVAHLLSLGALVGWSVRRTANLHAPPRTPPQDSMASFICAAVSMSCPEFRCTATSDLIVAVTQKNQPGRSEGRDVW